MELPSPRSQRIPVTLNRVINQSNFTLYLASSISSPKLFAMKVFPYKDSKANPSYLSELQALSLSHPNLIKYYDNNDRIWTFSESSSHQQGHYSSYILMELAPYGDLADVLLRSKATLSDIMVRTLFHHICEGVKYIHSKKFVHLDLKLENILLGDNYIPKICDYESMVPTTKFRQKGRGTKNYRAPEVLASLCEDGQAADVYALGILLLILQLKEYPYVEGYISREGIDYQALLLDGDQRFWKCHPSGHKVPESKSRAFKELVFGMTRRDPSKRLTLSQVMDNAWYKDSVLSKGEYVQAMKLIKV